MSPARLVLPLLLALAGAPACGGDDDGEGGDGGSGPEDAAVVDGASSDPDASSGPDANEVTCAPLGVSASTCGSGTGAVTSEIPDVSVDPVVSAWYQDFGECRSGIFIDERASNCDPEAVTDQVGHFVSIFFCNTPTVGSYEVVWGPVVEDQGLCPGERVVTILIQDEEFEDDVAAVSGSVDIDSIDGCLTGSFEAVSLDDEDFSGTFAAYTCP